MPTNHAVKQGEYLARIAAQHGFTDYRTIWDHPENDELKQRRKNPNVLYPGDSLFIPDKNEKEVTGQTEQKHRFRLQGSSLTLRLVLRGYDDEPIANAACELHVDGRVHGLTTDGSGRIEQTIPRTAETGVLIFQDPDLPIDRIAIQIGHLDPLDTTSGVQARLNNLGYDAGPIDGLDSQHLQGAIEEFQCDAFKTSDQVDGKCGPNTQARLKQAYGC